MQRELSSDDQNWAVEVRDSSNHGGPYTRTLSRPNLFSDQQVTTHWGPTFPSFSREQYTVAWICPLRIELTAARAMLDGIHQPVAQLEGDSNSYILGSVANHNVVLACLARTGTHAAGKVSYGLKRAFPAIQSWILVGIGGGVPSTVHDLRLGDVVIGRTVIPYDPKKQYQDFFLRTASQTHPPDRLLNAANTMISQHEDMQQRGRPLPIYCILEERKHLLSKYERPSTPDNLFDDKYIHTRKEDTKLRSYVEGPPPDPCQDCDARMLIHRAPRNNVKEPIVHLGDIASGDTLLRSSEVREKLGREDLKVACFEMEAAGLDQELPCLVIRGIADYADSHKNDEWQRFAAASAAACARELLMTLQPVAVRQYQEYITEEMKQREKRKQEVLESLKIDYVDGRRLSVEDKHKDTCEWFLELEDYKSWIANTESSFNKSRGLLWLRGNPGTGKSTLMKFAFEAHKKMTKGMSGSSTNDLLVSFFFQASHRDLGKSALGMYRGLLVQIFEGLPGLRSLLLDPDLVPPHGEFSLPILKRIFMSAVSNLGEHRLICYVDAFDECNDKEAREVIDHLQSIAKDSHKGSFQVLCSSRRYRNLDPGIGTILNLDELPGHTQDLKAYIKDRLKVENVPKLEELLLRKSKGIFFWVVLVVGILNQNEEEGISSNVDELEEELPDELYDLFLLILKREMPKSERTRSRLRPGKSTFDELETVVTWIMYGSEEMTLKAFPHALMSGVAVKQGVRDLRPEEKTMEWSIQKIEKRVISATKGLAEVKPHPTQYYPRIKTVQFVHESVRTFFRDGELHKDDDLGPLLRDSVFDKPALCHERLKQSCLWYITCPSIQDSVTDLMRTCQEEKDDGQGRGSREKYRCLRRQYPFLGYAMDEILNHANTAASFVSQRDSMIKLNEPFWGRISVACLGPLAIKVLKEPSRVLHSLHHVCALGHFQLLTCGAYDPNGLADDILNSLGLVGYTPIYEAAEGGYIEMVETLLNWGADIDKPSDGDSNQSPLMASLHEGHEDVAILLISKGADVHFVSRRGYTACHHAARMNCSSALRELIARGVDVNIKTSAGLTALMMACGNGPTGGKNAADILLDAGADVNATTRHGMTPLMMAAATGTLETARILITPGLDIHAMNEAGQTALDLARDSKVDSGGKVSMLVDEGAETGHPQDQASVSSEETTLSFDLDLEDNGDTRPEEWSLYQTYCRIYRDQVSLEDSDSDW